MTESERQQPRFFLIPTDLATKVINYLATRPWNEANPLIAEMTQMKPHGDDGPFPLPTEAMTKGPDEVQ